MRILLLSDYAIPVGGAEVVTDVLFRGLETRGHEVRLLASDAVHDGSSGADYPCFGTISRFQPVLEAYNPSASSRLRVALSEFDPHVVHVSMFLWQLSPSILPRLRHLPAVCHAQTFKEICPIGTRLLPDDRICPHRAGAICRSEGCVSMASWLPRMAQRVLWRRWKDAFDRIVPISAVVARRFAEHDILVTEPITPGVSVRPARPPLSDPPSVGFAGRLVPEKGLRVLLDAWGPVRERVPSARLVLAGDGPQREWVVERLQRAGLTGSVDMLPRLERDRLEVEFDRVWVQVAPSLWEEPFGLVAPEAMMRGTAVVASEIGGLTETVVHGRTGLLVPPGDAPALARALIGLLSTPERCESMGSAGRARALERHVDSRFVERFESLYRELVEA